ncbi:hypothetical protein M1446_04180 [Candidatus Dependentiae bacterium]|nr:hypothetical protein [Candidatus Dependentiae bacterium]
MKFFKRIFYFSLIQFCLFAQNINFEIKNNTTQTIYYSVTEQKVDVMKTSLNELAPQSSASDILKFAEYPQIYLVPNKTVGTMGKVYTFKALPNLATKTIYALVEKQGNDLVLNPNPGVLQSASVAVNASASLNVPEAGTFDTTLSGELNAANPTLIGSVSNFLFKGINLTSLSLMLQPKLHKYELVGAGKYNDLDASISLKRNPTETSLMGQFNKEFKPFSSIPGLNSVSVVRDISILSGGFDLARKTVGGKSLTGLEISGEAKIADQTFNAGIIIPLGAGPLAMFAQTPVNWKLSQTFKGLPSIFDNLELTNGKIVISSQQLTDSKGNSVPAGLTIQADFQDYKVTKDAGVKQLVGSAKATVAASIADKIRDSQVKVTFSGEIPGLNKGDAIKGGGASLILTAKPSAVLEFDLNVVLNKGDQPVVFKFAPELSATDVKITGAMQGCYNNAFGVKGFNMCDLSVNLNVNIPEFLVSHLPSGMGLSGRFELTPTKIIVLAGNFNTVKPQESYISGKLDGELTLQDIASVCQKMADNVAGKKIQADNLPDLAIKDVEYKVLPVGSGSVTVGQETINPGMTMKGTLRVLGHETSMSMNVQATGFMFDAYFQTLNIGDWITITGSTTRVPGQTKDGVYCSVAATLEQQHVYFSGLIKIKNVLESETRLVLSLKEGFDLHTETKLFGDKFTGTLDAKSGGGWKHPDFTVDIKFHNELQDYLSQVIINQLQIVQQKIDQAKADADKAFDDAQVEIKNSNAKAQRDLDAAKAESNSKLQGAQDTVNKLNNDINNIQRQIDDLNNWFNGLPKVDWPWKDSQTTRGPDYGIRWTALQTAKGTLIASRETALGVLKAAQATASGILTAAQKTAAGVLVAADKITDVAARKVTEGVLKGTSAVVYQGGKFVAVNVINGFAIKDLNFHGSLQEIVGGKLPSLNMTLTLFGKDENITVAIDFKDLANSVEAIGKQIVDKVKSALKL